MALFEEPELCVVIKLISKHAAYSSVRPGKSAARRELGATLADKLFFSGEATHLSQPSTVNGGLERGRAAALQAAAYLKRVS